MDESSLDDGAFVELSRLFAEERGADGYRLVTHGKKRLHSRHFRVDGTVYHLGEPPNRQSKRGSYYTTISLPDDSVTANDRIDRLETTGREVFGPDHPNHP